MKKNIIRSRILALLLTAAMCTGICTGLTVSAEEMNEGAKERTEQTEAGQVEETGEPGTLQTEEREEGLETVEKPETDKDNLLSEEEGAQEEREASENREEEQSEEQERKASSRASAAGLSDPRIVEDSGMEAGQKVTWDCVWFGSYPQSEVTSSDSVYSTLQNVSGWDSKNEIMANGNRYRRMKKEDATYATFGNGYYYNWSDSTTWHYFKYEPIKWRVLKINGNQALLLSDVALDDQKYHTVSEGITWENSTIRSWLNGYSASANQQGIDYSGKNFIGSAFTSGEQSAIVTTSVANADNIQYGTVGGNDTSDKVFLLSESEVYGDSARSHGFASNVNTSDEARKCKSSTYAKAMGAYDSTYNFKGNCNWCLRSPGRYSNYAAHVNSGGYVSNYGTYGFDSRNQYADGVRAALNLNLSSNQWSSAGTVCSDGTVNEKNSGSSSVVIPGKVIHYGMTQTEKTDAELVKEAANNFVKAENEYISAMNSTIKMGANTAKEAETIREKDQSSKQPILTLIVNDEKVSDEVMNAAYACLSDFFSEYKDATPSIGKIDISASMTSIESQIINTIRQSCQDVNVSTKYGKYVAHIKGKFLWGAFSCAITVTGNDRTYKGMVNSTLDDSGKVMASYIKVLGEAGEDVLKQGLKSYLKDFAKYTCISDFTKETMNNALVNVADYLQSKNWGKKVLEYGVKLYDGYDFVSSIVNAKNSTGLANSLSDAENIYKKIQSMSYTDSSVKDKAIKITTQNIEKARKNLEDALWNYIYHSKAESGTLSFWDKVKGTFKKITGHCPVDFVIYDEYGNSLGMAEDGYCEYDDSIYIEVSDDVKTIYIPDDVEIQINMTGTDVGTMSYVVEQYKDNVPIGRMNYYDIPLINGNTYNQTIFAGNFNTELDKNVLTTDNGSNIKANEYISANDSAIITLSCSVRGQGSVSGTGDYVKGDAVEFAAYPDDGYYFDGWYDGTTLVGVDAVYRLAALENKKLEAVFSKIDKSEQTIKCKDSYLASLGDKDFNLNVSAESKELYYTSSDKNIVDVDAKGNVSIIKEGDAQIYVLAAGTEEYNSAVKKIDIKISKKKTENINISKCTVELDKTSYVYTGYAIEPKIIVKSGKNILVENQDYSVSYKNNINVGNAKIVITGKGNYTGNVEKTFAITSPTVKVSKITLCGISKKIAAGKKIKLTAEVTPFNASNKAVTWKSSNTKVATVNSKGVVTLKKNSGGKKVTITATAKDESKKKATYKITSMKGIVKRVTISGKKTRTLKAGKTLKLKAKVIASNSKQANKTLKWTSSNTKYATVSSTGKVKTKKAGKGKTVKITVASTDGSNKKVSVKVKLK